ncbi:hypothetical protein [Pararhodobacter marinus]|uniref:hypothetical protein n=1 Tax=Pararhodobacter marinus TaxID=2184063 RepID=UPI003514E0FD
MGKKTKSPVAQPAKAAVLVLGMHRSGTSALAGVLSKLGCDLPKAIMEPSQANAKGFFESTAVRDLNEEILASAGTSWDDFLAVNPHWTDSPVAASYFARAVELVRTDFGDSPLIVLKDPRICRLVPFWTRVLEQAGYRVLPILTVRHPEEVARSLRQKKKFSRGLSHMIWLHYVLEAEVLTRGTPRYATSYDMLIRRWPFVVSEAAKTLGVHWPRGLDQVETVIEDFLSTELRHHQERPEDQGDNPLLVAWLRNTYAIFSRWAEQGEDADDYETLDTIREAFNDAARAFGRLVKVEREERRLLSEEVKTLEAARDSQRQRAEDAIARAQADTGKMTDDLSRKAAAMKDLEVALATRSQQLDAEQKARATEKDALTRKLTELEAELNRKASTAEKLEAALAARKQQLEDEQTTRRNDKDILTKKLLAARDEAAASERALAEALAASEARGQEVERLSATLRAEQARATAGERDKATLLAEHKTLTDRFENQRAEYERLKDSVSARDQELAQLTLVITQSDREISRLGKELTDAEAQREASRAELEALGNELAQVRSALLQRQHEAETTAAELSQAKAELSDARAELSEAQAGLSQMQAALSETRNDLSEARTEQAREAEAATRLRADLETARKSAQEMQDHLQDRFREVATLTQYAMKQQGEIDTLHSRVATLGDKLAKGESANAVLSRDSAQRVSEMAALHVDLSSLRYDLSAAMQERDALAREVAALRSSTSWRITGPLRRMIRLVRRG